MPIAASEIILQRSAATGSLGGARSSTSIGTDLFDAVAGTEAAAGRVEYRCVFVYNADPLLTLNGATLAVQSDSTSASTSLSVGVGTGAMGGSEPVVASETTAPASVSFGTSTNLGNIPPLTGRSAWIRRIVAAGAAALQADNSVLRVAGSYTE